jgi:Rad52/22 family double-strand break repair protein
MAPITKPRPNPPAEPLGEWDDQVSKTTEQPAGSQQAPTAPRQWTIAQIEAALSRPLPENMLESRKQGGQTIKYIPWHTVNKILDKYCPAWSWEMTITTTADRLIVVGRLTIPAAEGNIYREATGTELLKEERTVMVVDGDRRIPLIDSLGRTVTESKEIAFGDPCSNAESQSFRRAAARFGLGLYMYGKAKR